MHSREGRAWLQLRTLLLQPVPVICRCPYVYRSNTDCSRQRVQVPHNLKYFPAASCWEMPTGREAQGLSVFIPGRADGRLPGPEWGGGGARGPWTPPVASGSLRCKLMSVCVCFPPGTMKDTRLTALETELPIVLRTGKASAQSSGRGHRRELPPPLLVCPLNHGHSLHARMQFFIALGRSVRPA